MKLKRYLQDKIYLIFILLISYLIIFLLLKTFKCKNELIIAISFVYILTNILLITIDFLRRKNFYNNLLNNIVGLDKSYLVLETINEPNFYEGKLLYQALYDINKSMLENVKEINEQVDNFKEYIELWIHEVKIPLASLILMLNNNKNTKMLKQIKRIEHYIEQVLYYTRVEFAEKDYYIKDVNLKDVIKNIGLKYMDDLLLNKIDFKVDDIDYKVLTDQKWLEFIIGQIINNSIKYKKKDNSYIKISVEEYKDKVVLVIEDNGIGIKKSDIDKVFDKTFTGENGRLVSSSTGMGLTICKNLCNKLGHEIEIDSIYNEYTKVYIIFAKNNYYEVVT